MSGIERSSLSRAPRRGRRAVVLGLLVAVLTLLLGTPVASSAPVKDLNNLPTELQKYVPGSTAWSSSPWMTSATCAGRGGDFSLWASNVIADTPALLAHFQASAFGAEMQPEDKARNEQILAGYRKLPEDLRGLIPSGYCVDDLRRWAGPDPAAKPFGFPWGTTRGDGHQTIYFCTDREENATAESLQNRWFGAERAPCDAFYVKCDNAQESEKSKCETWNKFSDDYVRRVERLRGQAINDHPVVVTPGPDDIDTEIKSPSEIAADVADSWFVKLTKSFTQGSVSLMAEAMTWWTRTDRTDMLSDPAITDIQGQLKYIGIALLLGGVIWQGIMLIYRRKIDPLVSTGMGLLSFVAWSTLGGTVAILLNEAGVALTDQVLDESIRGFSETVGSSLIGNVGIATGAVFFLSIILCLLSCIQWALGFFRQGALVVLLALLPTAAAGQLNEKTKPWAPKIATSSLALLCYQPVAGIIYSIGMKLMGDGRDLSTALVGLAVLTLGVISMPTMMRFFDWGGQKFVNSGGGGGGAMATGAAASLLGGGSGVGGFGKFMDQNGPASRGSGDGDGGQSSGALPVTSAHAGDGPGGEGSAPASPGSSTGSPTGGSAGSAAQASPEAGVSSATGASTGASTAASGVGSSGATQGATAAGTAGTAGGTAGTAGGAAAAGGPAGLAASGVAEGASRMANAATGAMVEGAGEGESR
ncbi:hypothetical protein SUDANB95_08018 (plasmid) [Actinosynnema sp. ALI-1.44]